MAGRFQIWYQAQPPAIRLLLTINVAAYLVWNLFLVHFQVTRDFVWGHLALDPSLPGLLLEPWRVLTYAFLHLGPGLGGLLHILFNMAWLVWIGRDFEQMQGSARLFGIYILSALGGALLTVGLHAAFPSAGLFAGVVHGASGGVLGVMAAVALLYPYQEIMLLFIGSVRLLWVVFGFLALDVLFLSAGGTSVSAHLGGVLTGFAFARAQQAGFDLAAWARPLFGRKSRGRRPSASGWTGSASGWVGSRGSGSSGSRGTATGASTASGTRAGAGAGAGAAGGEAPRRSAVSALRKVVVSDPPAEPDPAAVIDRILDKISASGYDSLTAEEKRILYEASKK